MKSYVAWLVCLASVVLPSLSRAQSSPPVGSTSQPAPQALQQCVDLMLQAIDHAEGLLPEMGKAADATAKRWIEGAELFAGGDPSFTDEAFYRAGGLIGLRRIAQLKQNFNGRQMPWVDVPEDSVVLYGLLRNVDPKMVLFDELGHLAGERDTVVYFGSKQWVTSQKIVKLLQRRLPAEKVFFVDTNLPVDTSLVTGNGRHYGDYAGMATAVHMWAFTAEVVAACTRQGKTPGIWPSGAIPRYEVWEKKYEKIKFHDDFDVKPIGAGVLGRQYLQILREQVKACLASGSQVRAAARMLADVPADKAVYAMVESHLLAGETQLPMELPNWLLVQRGWRWKRAAPTIEKGDAIFWLGYIDWPEGEVKRAAQQQSPFVGVSIRAPGERVKDEPLVTPGTSSQPTTAILRDAAKAIASGLDAKPKAPATLPADVQWVRAPWEYPDAVVAIAGYPLPACPTSAVVQGTLLWSVIGEVLASRPAAASDARK